MAAHKLIVRKIVDDLETPVSAYLKLVGQDPYGFLFESVEGGALSGRYTILTLDPDLIWRSYGERAEVGRGDLGSGFVFSDQQDPTLLSLKKLIDAHRCDIPAHLPPMAMGVFGVFGYDLIRQIEPLGKPNPDPHDLPDAILVRPRTVLIFDNVAHEITLACPIWDEAPKVDFAAKEAEANKRLDDIINRLRMPLERRTLPVQTPAPVFTSSVSETQFCEKVEAAKGFIQAGDIFQLVLSHRFVAKVKNTAFAFYRSLRRTNPSPYLFYLNFGNFQLAGSSPEILIRVRDGKITLRPIAGTRPRGLTPEADKAMELELLSDPKELSEHLMLLDLGRNDVGRVAKPASVRVTEKFTIERYSHVLHIVSNVEGEAPEALDPVDALMAALPAGTLSGAPKVRAMEIIDDLESLKRGVGYAGGIGYISSGGAIDVCIVLRTALFQDGQMFVQSGAGIVADSVPKSEYEETCHKASALFKAATEAWRYED